MNKAGKILQVDPPNAIEGGEIAIECEGFTLNREGEFACYIGGKPARLTAASSTRVLAVLPENENGGRVQVYLESGSDRSEPASVLVGKKLVEDMHIVANPAIDPRDDSILLTRSGSRGQELPATLYRLETDGFLDELPAEITNPTGIAFDTAGELYVTNRNDGEVCRIEGGNEAVTFAGGLGVATGLAFDAAGVMYVGDRSGTIYRISEFGTPDVFATIEPSVSAYHIAFGPDGRLYVTAPGLASYDPIQVIDHTGTVEKHFRGFGRPQGLAFDREGNLYLAGCYRGRHGIVKVDAAGQGAETVVAGMNLVGLCFSRQGEMIVATNDAVYSLSLGIYGTLLD
jgi:DNA-binding beta-propeller fold protein YncE